MPLPYLPDNIPVIPVFFQEKKPHQTVTEISGQVKSVFPTKPKFPIFVNLVELEKSHIIHYFYLKQKPKNGTYTMTKQSNKTQKYAAILANYILAFEAKFEDANDGLTTLSVIDTERHHYQSLLYGHQDDRFLFIVQFHFDIINDQIWLQQNNTDIDLGEELINLGIPKSDIVLGFLTDFEREYSDYGVPNVLVNA